MRPVGPEALRQVVDPWCRWAIADIPTIPRLDGKKNLYLPTLPWEGGRDETKWLHAKGLPVKRTADSQRPIIPGVDSVNFCIKRLPEDNRGFGRRRLYLDLIGTPGDYAPKLCETRHTEVRLFFYRFATDHPVPQEPKKDKTKEDKTKTANWHYYWSKEGGEHPEGKPEKGKNGPDGKEIPPKTAPVCMFSRTANDPDYAAWDRQGQGDSREAYGQTSKDGNITLFDRAAKTERWNYKFPEGANPTPDSTWPAFTITTTNAPDFVNVTYAHERTHAIIFMRGLARRGTNPEKKEEASLDFDRDGVHNGEEIALGMNPSRADSFKNAFSISRGSPASRDAEFYCVFGGALSPHGQLTKPEARPAYAGQVPSDANEDNDWSKGGVQWQKD